MDEEKYEEIAGKRIETDHLLAELVGVETLLGIGIVLAITELQHVLRIPEGFVAFVLVILIGFFIWELFQIEETERDIEKQMEDE